MPELPEVETVRRGLCLHLTGRQVLSVTTSGKQLRRPLDAGRLHRKLVGRRFKEPRRRGKYLLLDTSPGGALLVHLGMSGRLTVNQASTPRKAHTHLVVGLDDQRQLRFSDPRRFGLCYWLGPGDEEIDPSLAALGIEPLLPELPELLPDLLRRSAAPIKSLLLNQSLVAGVGNIYAAEALWLAGIRPTRPGNSISRKRLARLANAVQEVLTAAIDQGGTTLRDYASVDDSAGLFKVRLQVYGRQGQPCPNCGTNLRSTTISNRSTVWCGNCQR
jgi:formamidopyrimidine-DNA glycosylase